MPDNFSWQTLMRIQSQCICNCYDFTTPIRSKCCSICYCLAIIKSGSFEIPNFGGLWECQELGICTNRKLTHDFTVQSCTLYLQPFGRNANVKLWPPVSELSWAQRVENDTNRNVVTAFPFDFNTHYRPIMQRLATIYATLQTHTTYRAIGIGRLCHMASAAY